MAKHSKRRELRNALRKYFYRSLEPRYCDVDHLIKWLRKRSFKITRHK
jgi:hypothetical protein